MATIYQLLVIFSFFIRTFYLSMIKKTFLKITLNIGHVYIKWKKLFSSLEQQYYTEVDYSPNIEGDI